MNWAEEAEDYASAHHTYEHRSEHDNAFGNSMFALGAKWQRDQLRTDEAVARLANFLHNDDVGETLNEHDKSCRIPDCDERNLYTEYAHAAINALLGEEPCRR